MFERGLPLPSKKAKYRVNVYKIVLLHSEIRTIGIGVIYEVTP
jgi:hypothetical protein